MKVRSLLLFLLVLAALSVDLAAATAAVGHPYPSLAATFLLGLALAQIGLLAAWLAIGPGNIGIRYGACVLAILCFSWPLAQATLPHFAEWLGVLGVCLTAVAVPVFLFRWIFWELPGRRTARPSGSRGRLASGQWTLAGILSLTTVVAISLAFARRVEFPDNELVGVVITCVVFSAATLVALAVTRYMRKPSWRITAVLLICPLMAAVVGTLIGTTRYASMMAAVTLVQSLAVVFFIEVLRMRGDPQSNSAQIPRRPA